MESSGGISASEWIVLGVGVATVAAQVVGVILLKRVADRQVEAAERQVGVAMSAVDAANLQLQATEEERKQRLSSFLIPTRESLSSDRLDVRLYNGGRYPASRVVVEAFNEAGEVIGSATCPVVSPEAPSDLVVVPLGGAEQRQAVERVGAVRISWADGLGRHGPIEESFAN